MGTILVVFFDGFSGDANISPTIATATSTDTAVYTITSTTTAVYNATASDSAVTDID